MSKAHIVHAGRPVLRARAAEVSPEELGSRALVELARKMVDAMRRAPGVGLAAPQIGVSKRVVVFEDGERLMAKLSPAERELRGRVPVPLTVLVNPVLTIVDAEEATFFEGCLSIPGYMALVPRARAVRVSAVNERGDAVAMEVAGWPARILQHEIDHLDGALYVDRMLSRSFGQNPEIVEHWLGLPVAEAREKLGT